MTKQEILEKIKELGGVEEMLLAYLSNSKGKFKEFEEVLDAYKKLQSETES